MDSSSLLVSLAAGLTFLCVRYHFRVFSFWSSRGIKGPRPWPILGTSIYYMFKNKIQQDLEWSQEYGKVYGIYEGYFPALRVMDNELLKQVYIKEWKSFTDRNNKFVKGDNISNWVFFSKGNHWNNQRVLLTPMFTSLKMRTMFQTLIGCVDRFIEEVAGSKRPKGEEEETSVNKLQQVQVQKNDLLFLTLDVISKSFFGLNLNTYRNKTSRFCEKAFAFASFDVIYGLIYFAIPATIREFFKMDLTRPYKYEYFDKLSQSTIKQRRADMSSPSDDPESKKNDFIQTLIDAEISNVAGDIYSKEDALEAAYNDNMDLNQLESIHKEQQAKEMIKFRKFSDLEIRANMTFLFLAGFETTSNTLGFMLFCMAHHQELQREIYEQELLAIGENLDYEHLSSLRMFNAFISEVLRLYNPVTENNRVVTARDGFELPTNPPIHLPYDTTISTNAFVVQRDPDYWPDPLKLDISRFYPENKDKIKSCTYMPFGLGPRNCVGMRFALMTVKTSLAKILVKYHVRPGPGNVNPPQFNQHGFFSQLANNDLLFKPRASN